MSRDTLLVWRPKGRGGVWTAATDEEHAAWDRLAGHGARRMPGGQAYVRRDGAWRRWTGA